jgi:hypothetical protein
MIISFRFKIEEIFLNSWTPFPLLEKLDDLKDLRDPIEALKEYQSGKYISFDRYDAPRKVKRV